MITTEMLSDVQRLHHSRMMHFTVEPRYTSGRPGVVGQDEALALARDELQVFGEAMRGVHGDEDFDRAVSVGVGGVSTLWVEMPRAWRVYDLITRELHDIPFVGAA